jgi:hypothetical protein
LDAPKKPSATRCTHRNATLALLYAGTPAGEALELIEQHANSAKAPTKPAPRSVFGRTPRASSASG